MGSKRIAVVGGGPIGLEAALYGSCLGHEVTLFERGTLAANVAAWGFMPMFTPWCMNTTPLGMCMLGKQNRCDTDGLKHLQPECYVTGAELRQTYLLPLVQLPMMEGVVREQSTVMSIGREDPAKPEAAGQRANLPFRLLVRDRLGGEYIERADVVLDCSGTYGNHRWAGRGGIPAPGEQALEDRIWYLVPDVLGKDRKRFAGRHTLLVGCGLSAVSVLANLRRLAEEEPGTRVSWAIRRPGQGLEIVLRDPLEERRRVVREALALLKDPPSWLQFLGLEMIEKISANGRFQVVMDGEHGPIDVTSDEVVCMVGYSPDASIFEQLQVHQRYAAGAGMVAAALLGEITPDRLPEDHKADAEALRNPEPHFFILGAKSYGTNSNFLLEAGHRQIRDAYRLIEENKALDLYQPQERPF